mmetsp:Transcript_4153/g.15198  ORF Transcript_4153/g.15198 Transcript_4153/m.15198 type:complete len:586 (-) Transcript_4153:1290-3047(-)
MRYHSLLAVARAFVILVGVLASFVDAKRVEGNAQLTSALTELVLGKFSVAKSGGTIDLSLTTTSKGWDRGAHKLELLVMNDAEYFAWRAQLKAGSLCADRNKAARQRHYIDIPHAKATHKAPGYEWFVDPQSGDHYRINVETGNGTWMHPSAHNESAVTAITHRETSLHVKIRDTKSVQVRTKMVEYGVSSNWFFVLCDCALEFYPATPPPLRYELDLRNENEGHLPQDIRGLGAVYAGLLLFMLGTMVAFAVLAYKQYTRASSIHALVLAVMLAYWFQVGALALELMHITVYSFNGKGLRWRHSYFAADFAAEVLQGMSEYITEFVLLFLVCGWTTLSMTISGLGGSLASFGSFASLESGDDTARTSSNEQSTISLFISVLKSFFHIDSDNPDVKYRISLVAAALRSPVNMLKRGADTTVGVVILLFFGCVHLILELMARKHHEDFEAFHDHDHWPGYALVGLRVFFAILFIVAGGSTFATAKRQQDPPLSTFIRHLLIIGAGWLLAFPFVVFTASFVPLVWRHRYVAGGCAMLQCVALAALGVLVLVDESFKKMSSVSMTASTDSSRRQTLGSRGLRAKVAID